MTTKLRDSRGRFMAQRAPDPGPYWIEAPTDPQDWQVPNACSVVDLRRPKPDPRSEGGKGFDAVFMGTFAECDAWLERNA